MIMGENCAYHLHTIFLIAWTAFSNLSFGRSVSINTNIILRLVEFQRLCNNLRKMCIFCRRFVASVPIYMVITLNFCLLKSPPNMNDKTVIKNKFFVICVVVILLKINDPLNSVGYNWNRSLLLTQLSMHYM